MGKKKKSPLPVGEGGGVYDEDGQIDDINTLFHGYFRQSQWKKEEVEEWIESKIRNGELSLDEYSIEEKEIIGHLKDDQFIFNTNHYPYKYIYKISFDQKIIRTDNFESYDDSEPDRWVIDYDDEVETTEERIRSLIKNGYSIADIARSMMDDLPQIKSLSGLRGQISGFLSGKRRLSSKLEGQWDRSIRTEYSRYVEGFRDNQWIWYSYGSGV